MLEKFNAVKKVGLFHDLTHAAGCEIDTATLIYGENGVGKSTLAAILDSLRERSPSEVIRRKTLPGTVPPQISISLGGKTYEFNGTEWNDQPPIDSIDVFFSGFVTRNVHAATAVDADHKRQLCEFVLGREAIRSLNRLTEADNQSRHASTERRNTETQLQLHIKKPDSIEQFISLNPSATIEADIAKVRAELQDAQSKAAILSRPLPTEISLPNITADGVSEILTATAESIPKGAANEVRQHIKAHLDEEGEVWLGYGARHLGANKECPFCAQDISQSKLLPAIEAYFSQKYRDYLKGITQAIEKLRNSIGSAVFPQLRTRFNEQIANAAQWSESHPIDQVNLTARIDEAAAHWSEGTTLLGALLSKKQSSPLDPLKGELAEPAIAQYTQAVAKLAEVNAILRESRNAAEEKRKSLLKGDVAEIQTRLARLENTKARFEPAAMALIKKRQESIDLKTKLDTEKTVLKKEIDTHASRVIAKYQDGINHFLSFFGCDIRIDSVEPKFPGGKASVQYTLKVNGHEIQLGVSEIEPSFETVLSDGDKFTLALSLFLARLKAQDDIKGRVVVLDDPVTSLGNSRRGMITQAIRELSDRGAQVIVLTHDERLAAQLWSGQKKLPALKPLQVERTAAGSLLRPWNIEAATQSRYVRDYLVLTNFVNNGGDHEKAAGSIRSYLEHRLRHLYPGGPFISRDTLGQMIGKIRDSKPGSRIHGLQEKLADLEAINNSALPIHHATDDVPTMDPLGPDGVRIVALKALEVLG